MQQKHLLIIFALLVTVGLLAACSAAAQTQTAPAEPAAQANSPQVVKMPEVAIQLSDDGFTVPAKIPAGIVAVNISNSSTKFQEGGVVLGKLKEGVTYDEVKAPSSSDDLVTALGGAEHTIYNLAPGQYVVFFIGNVEGEPPLSSLITVKDEGNTAAPPTTEITAEMQDYNFILPDEIKAGKHIWHISNKGKQAHHLLMFQLPKDVTVDDVIAWVSTEPPSGPPPFLNPDGPTIGAGFEVLSASQSAWAEIDLPPGEYTVFCLLPDMSAQPPMSHIAHGMHRILKVVE
ncbi:MAG: hypothetical protein U0401_14375 [Anaerolineae bacterium]